MAKGFTVKAKTPIKQKKGPEWDIEAIKGRMRGKRIVFCLPGRGCSYVFLKNFVQLCFDMVQSTESTSVGPPCPQSDGPKWGIVPLEKRNPLGVLGATEKTTPQNLESKHAFQSLLMSEQRSWAFFFKSTNSRDLIPLFTGISGLIFGPNLLT